MGVLGHSWSTFGPVRDRKTGQPRSMDTRLACSRLRESAYAKERVGAHFRVPFLFVPTLLS